MAGGYYDLLAWLLWLSIGRGTPPYRVAAGGVYQAGAAFNDDAEPMGVIDGLSE